MYYFISYIHCEIISQLTYPLTYIWVSGHFQVFTITNSADRKILVHPPSWDACANSSLGIYRGIKLLDHREYEYPTL